MEMKILLDTNIVIGLLKNEISIIRFLKQYEEIAVPIITVGELLYGAALSGKSEDNKLLYANFFQNVDIINIEYQTAFFYSEIRLTLKNQGTPIPENDLWIAAITKEKNFLLLTRDKHLLNLSNIINVQEI